MHNDQVPTEGSVDKECVYYKQGNVYSQEKERHPVTGNISAFQTMGAKLQKNTRKVNCVKTDKAITKMDQMDQSVFSYE